MRVKDEMAKTASAGLWARGWTDRHPQWPGHPRSRALNQFSRSYRKRCAWSRGSGSSKKRSFGKSKNYDPKLFSIRKVARALANPTYGVSGHEYFEVRGNMGDGTR